MADEDEDGDTVWKPAKLAQWIEETTAKYSDDGKGISILAEDGNFKSTYDILYEISEIWDKINSNEQSALLERMAGKHRATVVAALLSDSERLKEALDTAQDSAGSALTEWEKRTKSIEHALGSLNAAWQEFSINTIPAETVVNFINFAQAILELAQNVGPIQLLSKALGAIAGIGLVTKVGPWLSTKGEEVLGVGSDNKTTSKEYLKNSIEKVRTGVIDLDAQWAKFDSRMSNGLERLEKGFVGLGKTIASVGKILAKSFAIGFVLNAAVDIIADLVEKYKYQKHEVSELAGEVTDLTSSISGLKEEKESLESGGILTGADKNRLKELEYEIKLQERLLEIKKENQNAAFIESSNKYYNNDKSGVNTEFYDINKNADKVIQRYKEANDEVKRFQENVEYYTEKLSKVEYGSDDYERYTELLTNARTNLTNAQKDANTVLSDMGDSLTALKEQYAYYEDAIVGLSGEQRKQLLEEKASTDEKIRSMEILLGLISTNDQYKEEVGKLSVKIGAAKAKVKEFDKVLSDAKDTKKLTNDQMKDLRKEYPELAAEVEQASQKVSDGYLLEETALNILTRAYYEAEKAQYETEIEKTEVLMEQIKERIRGYEIESAVMANMYKAHFMAVHGMSDVNLAGSYEDMRFNTNTIDSMTLSEEDRQYYKDLEEYYKLLNELDNLKLKFSEIDEAIANIGNGDGDVPETNAGEAADVFDKYANALAKAREEVEAYGAAVELAQAKLDLNQSQEERTVDLLAQERQLYADLISAQEAQYKITNDTLWLQAEQLKVVQQQAKEKIAAIVPEYDTSDIENWTAADVEEFVELHLTIDGDDANAVHQDLANYLNAMVDMKDGVNELHVEWYNLKQTLRETRREELQSILDWQDDSLEKFDDARKQTEMLLDLLGEVEGTEQERMNLAEGLAESYEAQKDSILAMHESNSAKMNELAGDLENNQELYQMLLKQNEELEENYLSALQGQLGYKQQLLELEKEYAEQLAETEIYGEQGQDKWEEARQEEIDALNDQIEALQKKAEEDDYAKQMAEYEEELAEKESEIAELYQKIDNLRAQKTVQTLKEQEDGSFQWEYVADEIAINEALQEIADKEVEIEEVKNEIKEAEEERALEEEIAYLEAQIEAIEDEVDRRQKLYDEEVDLIYATYQREMQQLSRWLQDEIANWQARIAASEANLAKYDQVNVEGWQVATENTNAALTELSQVYTDQFNYIMGVIKNYEQTAMAAVQRIHAAIAAAKAAARDAEREAGGSDGSHANGLKFVESNNYIARLHYGERVLTRQEARQYNELEDDIKSGRLADYFESAKIDAANSISTAVSASVGKIGSTNVPTASSTSTSFVIEHLELPNVQDSQDFAAVLQSWARNEFGGLSQKAKIVKSR